MKTIKNGKEFKVKKSGNKYFYWGPRAMRWLPVAKKEVIFND